MSTLSPNLSVCQVWGVSLAKDKFFPSDRLFGHTLIDQLFMLLWHVRNLWRRFSTFHLTSGTHLIVMYEVITLIRVLHMYLASISQNITRVAPHIIFKIQHNHKS